MTNLDIGRKHLSTAEISYLYNNGNGYQCFSVPASSPSVTPSLSASQAPSRSIPGSPSVTPSRTPSLSVSPSNPALNAYYVSTTGNDSTGDGSIGNPWATWEKGFTMASAGNTVYIRGGTYTPSSTYGYGNYNGVYITGKYGTSGSPIIIQNYPGEVPILDGANIVENGVHKGLEIISCSYIILKGLIIQNIKEYGQYLGCPIAGGIELVDCTNITHDQIVVQGCGDGFETSGSCDYIYYNNCDAYYNWSWTDNGNFANGFTITNYGSTVQGHIFLDGCRSWHNSDDAYDTFSSDGSYQGGYITWNNCWAFDNGWSPEGVGNGNGHEGNGDGFKWGHTYTPNLGVIQRTITNCLSFNNHGVNGEIGFDQSEGNCMAWIVNNVAYHNLNSGFFNDVDGVVSTFRNNISYANGVVDVFESAQVRDHDSWTINSGGYTVTDNDFLSVDWTGTDGPEIQMDLCQL